MNYSINGFFLVEPYLQGQGLKSEVKSGFSYVQQKSAVIGLKTLVDAKYDDRIVKAGAIVFISEELLTTQEWAKKVKKADLTDGKEFVIVEARNIIGIKENE